MTNCIHCNRLISDPEAAEGRRSAGKRCERCAGTGFLSAHRGALPPPSDGPSEEFYEIVNCNHCGGYGRIAGDGAGTICPTCAVCERAEREEGSEE